MAELRNFKRLMRSLEKYERESLRKDTGNVIVGFQANYALYVHEFGPSSKRRIRSDAERRAMFAAMREREKRGHKSWRVGQPKFLEQPARELSNNGELARLVFGAVKQGVGLVKALIVAGQRLQREAQELVPVDTSNLKGSAFTAKE